jgi:23S rRNA pseudouridine955/2504/2580 synthase
MNRTETRMVAADEAGLRLDRWFKRYFPTLNHGRLEKLLRTGQVRVDGKRVRAGERLASGQEVRVPPLGELAAKPSSRDRPLISAQDAEDLRALVIYRDDEVIAINKPPGLAVQGGTGTDKHLDGMLDALRFGAKERPRLVHRLDRDTSGVLVLARSAAAAARLGQAFRQRNARKLYWAATVGVPRPHRGKIDLALNKKGGPGGERVAVDAADGQRAVTLYHVVDTAGQELAWVAFMPLTGRTHQLRVHAQALGTPVLGDGKYGGADALLTGAGLSKKLHLHARSLVLPRPARSGKDGPPLSLEAPLPRHMAATWKLFGWNPDDFVDPFPVDV